MGLYALDAVLLLTALGLGLWLTWDAGGERLRQFRRRLELVEEAQRREPRLRLALLRDDLLSEIPALHRWLGRVGRGSQLKLWLLQAGWGWRPGKFLLVCAAAGVSGGLLGLVAGSNLAGVAGLAAGATAPAAWVAWRRRRRLAAFQLRFPQALDLLVRASRAGHPPNTTLELIANETAEPVAGEFRQVFDQQRFGLPLRDCLLNLAQRVPLVDVKFFAVAMNIQRESGGNLAEILDNLGALVRERMQLRRQIRTHTAQGRMTLMLLMALAPALLLGLTLLSRAFVSPLFTDPLGQAMVGTAAALQAIGLVILRKIVALEV